MDGLLMGELNLEGFSELHEASIDGEIEIVKALLNAKADINERTKSDETALHLAALNREPKVVKILLSKGAAIMHNQNHQTAIDLARLERAKLIASQSTSEEEIARLEERIARLEEEIGKLEEVENTLQKAITTGTCGIDNCYGISVNHVCEGSCHPEHLKFESLDGTVRCRDVMEWYARKVSRHWLVLVLTVGSAILRDKQR